MIEAGVVGGEEDGGASDVFGFAGAAERHGMLAATAVMIAANVRSAWPDPTAVLMQAWVPEIALWLWHTLAAGRKPWHR